MKIKIIKADEPSNVRLRKYFIYFLKEKIDFEFVGWKRQKDGASEVRFPIIFLLRGGGYGSKTLFLLYPLWMIKLFFYIVFHRNLGAYKLIAVNFDCAFPIYLASLIRRVNYIYEIHDDFALSYNFPTWLKSILIKIDKRIKAKAKNIIHVDINRKLDSDENVIIIENSPYDFYKGQSFKKVEPVSLSYAIIGNISKARGALQILDFATENPEISFLVAGKFYDYELKDAFLSRKNIIYYDYMPQEELFVLLSNCSGIFSIYDPSLEINRLAASNKVYDAMMLGIPVITNKEVINSSFIRNHDIGFVINYEVDFTWDILKSKDFLSIASNKGANGRKLFCEKYDFERLIESNLLPIL